MLEMFGEGCLLPEQKFMQAIIRRAVWDFLHPGHQDVGWDKHFEARDWLLSPDTAFMTFRYYCEQVSDIPDDFAAKLLARIGLLH